MKTIILLTIVSEESVQFWPDLVFGSSSLATFVSSLGPPCLWLLIQLKEKFAINHCFCDLWQKIWSCKNAFTKG